MVYMREKKWKLKLYGIYIYIGYLKIIFVYLIILGILWGKFKIDFKIIFLICNFFFIWLIFSNDFCIFGLVSFVLIVRNIEKKIIK